jgi:hypothetical protein
MNSNLNYFVRETIMMVWMTKMQIQQVVMQILMEYLLYLEQFWNSDEAEDVDYREH